MTLNKKKVSIFTKQLEGAHLVNIRRAAQMPRLQFSHIIDMNATMHMHIQCAYRLSNAGKILLASSDIYQPNSQYVVNQDFDFDNFDWDISGNNRYDEIVHNELLPQILNISENTFKVEHVEVSDFGDVKLSFKNGSVFEIFNDTSGEEESWRFFSTIDKNKFIVMTGVGIER